jgi:pyruvate kinase
MTSPTDPHARVKTKIIATVGPATESVERLSEILTAGVNIVRLNMAHGKPDWRAELLGRLRDLSKRLGKPIGVLADLSGPKIRLGAIAGGCLQCEPGQLLRFVSESGSAAEPSDLTSTYAPLVSELAVGDLVLLADGTVSMRVQEKTATTALCSVEQAGEIRTGGGINLPGVELSVPALTDKDREDLRWAVGAGVDFVGLSFVRRAADVRELRDELKRLGSPAQIVAKIEKPQAVAALDDIIGASDAIMVARGDLGVEIDVARVPVVQKDIIARCHQARVPVITATQMLESMRTNRIPTRAEATDVANAILDGSDAVMLSAETAMGQYPVEAVATMSRIAREAEHVLEPRFGRREDGRPQSCPIDITESLVEATSRMADQVCAKLIIVATRTGNTAKFLSKQRSRTPIIGISDTEVTVRRMCLYWGVTPLVAPDFRDSAQLLEHVTSWAKGQSLVTAGDRVVLIASTHWTATGHNMIGVHEVK